MRDNEHSVAKASVGQILLYYYTVILLYCYTVILLYCYSVIVLYSHTAVIVLYSHTVILTAIHYCEGHRDEDHVNVMGGEWWVVGGE